MKDVTGIFMRFLFAFLLSISLLATPTILVAQENSSIWARDNRPWVIVRTFGGEIDRRIGEAVAAGLRAAMLKELPLSMFLEKELPALVGADDIDRARKRLRQRYGKRPGFVVKGFLRREGEGYRVRLSIRLGRYPVEESEYVIATSGAGLVAQMTPFSETVMRSIRRQWEWFRVVLPAEERALAERELAAQRQEAERLEGERVRAQEEVERAQEEAIREAEEAKRLALAKLEAERREMERLRLEALRQAEEAGRLARERAVQEAERIAQELAKEAERMARLRREQDARERTHREERAVQEIRTMRTEHKKIELPAGVFVMGCVAGDPLCQTDESPRRQVTLHGFLMDRTEVTNRLYDRCVRASVCSAAHYEDGTCEIWDQTRWRIQTLDEGWSGEDRPATCVTWSQAKAYCDWVGGALPTEAQWEYAARGGGRDIVYPWGMPDPTCERANYGSTVGGGCGERSPWKVCALGVDTLGMCDLAGNVWEWTADWYADNGYERPGSTDPLGPSQGEFKVMRGGSWDDPASELRATFRGNAQPQVARYHLGFRCVYGR